MNKLTLIAAIAAIAVIPTFSSAADTKTVWLDEMDVRLSSCGWNSTQKNKSVGGNPLSIGGTTYQRGIGTHAYGEFRIKLDKGTRRFTALVGIDAETEPSADVGANNPGGPVGVFVNNILDEGPDAGLDRRGEEPRLRRECVLGLLAEVDRVEDDPADLERELDLRDFAAVDGQALEGLASAPGFRVAEGDVVLAQGGHVAGD